MQSIKLSITCRGPLEAKYSAAGLARIDAAIDRWIAADAVRGIRTVHVAVDRAAATRPFGVAALRGPVTAVKVKAVLDRLVRKLAPDYVVLIGSGDVVPLFEVGNPTLDAVDGDTDPSVPTDNPYACSRPFVAGTQSSYLVPDRVLGRIPDLPGSADSRWLTSALAAATRARSRPAADYTKDLLVCADTWKRSGRACVKYLARDVESMMSCPPTLDTSATLRGRHDALLQMIKCHGAPEDSAFYGQKGNRYPEALRSPSLQRRTRGATVVGAMCCFGASVFDPASPAAQRQGEPPIPSVYLRQGAFGFVGSTCTAWVGLDAMMCADWVVSAFLKSVLNGASLGRAALEGKQDFLRWTQQRGEQLDGADEKTLIQFVLLGDPSIHPVVAPAVIGAPAAAGKGRISASFASARRQRRVARHQLGGILRQTLPTRSVASRKTVPTSVKRAARQLSAGIAGRFAFDLGRWVVERVVTPAPPAELAPAGRAAAQRRRAESFQYYSSARHESNAGPQIRLLSVQADREGNVLRSQLLASS